MKIGDIVRIRGDKGDISSYGIVERVVHSDLYEKVVAVRFQWEFSTLEHYISTMLEDAFVMVEE